MLADACQWLGAQGIERIFVALDPEEALTQQVFRRVGFVGLRQDRILSVRAGDLAPADGAAGRDDARPAGLEGRIVPIGSQHLPELDQLVAAERRAALGSTRAEISGDPPAWRDLILGGRRAGRLPEAGRLLSDADGSIRAALCCYRGREASWLVLAGRPSTSPSPSPRAPDASRDAPIPNGVSIPSKALGLARTSTSQMTRFVAQSLVDLGAGRLPADHRFYLTLPLDASGHAEALGRLGFTPFGERTHWIKQTTARILEPTWRVKPVPAKGAGIPTPNRMTRIAWPASHEGARSRQARIHH